MWEMTFQTFAVIMLLIYSGKTQFEIEDYSFSQTTLEQVFIEFAKQQEAEENESRRTVG